MRHLQRILFSLICVFSLFFGAASASPCFKLQVPDAGMALKVTSATLIGGDLFSQQRPKGVFSANERYEAVMDSKSPKGLGSAKSFDTLKIKEPGSQSRSKVVGVIRVEKAGYLPTFISNEGNLVILQSADAKSSVIYSRSVGNKYNIVWRSSDSDLTKNLRLKFEEISDGMFFAHSLTETFQIIMAEGRLTETRRLDQKRKDPSMGPSLETSSRLVLPNPVIISENGKFLVTSNMDKFEVTNLSNRTKQVVTNTHDVIPFKISKDGRILATSNGNHLTEVSIFDVQNNRRILTVFHPMGIEVEFHTGFLRLFLNGKNFQDYAFDSLMNPENPAHEPLPNISWSLKQTAGFRLFSLSERAESQPQQLVGFDHSQPSLLFVLKNPDGSRNHMVAESQKPEPAARPGVKSNYDQISDRLFEPLIDRYQGITVLKDIQGNPQQVAAVGLTISPDRQAYEKPDSSYNNEPLETITSFVDFHSVFQKKWIRRISVPGHVITAVGIHPSLPFLFVAAGGELRLYRNDRSTDTPLETLDFPSSPIAQIVFTDRGTVQAIDRSGTLFEIDFTPPSLLDSPATAPSAHLVPENPGGQLAPSGNNVVPLSRPKKK